MFSKAFPQKLELVLSGPCKLTNSVGKCKRKTMKSAKEAGALDKVSSLVKVAVRLRVRALLLGSASSDLMRFS